MTLQQLFRVTRPGNRICQARWSLGRHSYSARMPSTVGNVVRPKVEAGVPIEVRWTLLRGPRKWTDWKEVTA